MQCESITPLALSATDAAALIGVGKSCFYEMHSSGRLGPMPISLTSKKKVWLRRELELWCKSRMPARDEWLQILKEHNDNGD